ncbi:hypothetical protein [Candidatus Magnetominusculus xianensis]|uniref:Secreted protein n=1 Tax=Candidatus Magnetominusculus xianensis TaxID=1748249 RepID=A0ABR5SI89_9BACT|nr:hypothetical protein [Candidatus Magnetominusculus xianensis]KWT91013.1 hypothetical protein ASN18_0960 [Candidatus Magnetominusculus xianensis]MBF0402594.1 hypothetical protein [Nitrospirota bacterium]
MTLIIRNKLAVSAVVILLVAGITCTGFADECEYTYYYISKANRKNYETERVRIIEMSVNDAYIYDLPSLPSSWVYDISNSEDSVGISSSMTATSKSDNHTIKFKDLENFVILRRPKSKDGRIRIWLTIVYMTKRSGTSVMVYYSDDNEVTVQKIDKCLPEIP